MKDHLLDETRRLIESGADIERRDPNYGHTRLYSAAFWIAPDSVEYLLESGADPHAEQPNKKTPLHAICWKGEGAAEDENATVRIIKTLVAAGVDVDAADWQGNTPLMEAICGDWENSTAVRTLVALGADLNRADNLGTTPLMLAAEPGRMESFRELIRAGADVCLTDKEGRNVLDYAMEAFEEYKQLTSEPLDNETSVDKALKDVTCQDREDFGAVRECVEIIVAAMKK